MAASQRNAHGTTNGKMPKLPDMLSTASSLVVYSVVSYRLLVPFMPYMSRSNFIYFLGDSIMPLYFDAYVKWRDLFPTTPWLLSNDSYARVAFNAERGNRPISS